VPPARLGSLSQNLVYRRRATNSDDAARPEIEPEKRSVSWHRRTALR
jgi:hypothetical protein